MARVFVGGLPLEDRAGDLEPALRQLIESHLMRHPSSASSASSAPPSTCLAELRVMRDEDGDPRGFAFCELSDASAGPVLAKGLNKIIWRGSALRVEIGKHEQKQAEKQKDTGNRAARRDALQRSSLAAGADGTVGVSGGIGGASFATAMMNVKPVITVSRSNTKKVFGSDNEDALENGDRDYQVVVEAAADSAGKKRKIKAASSSSQQQLRPQAKVDASAAVVPADSQDVALLSKPDRKRTLAPATANPDSQLALQLQVQGTRTAKRARVISAESNATASPLKPVVVSKISPACVPHSPAVTEPSPASATRQTSVQSVFDDTLRRLEAKKQKLAREEDFQAAHAAKLHIEVLQRKFDEYEHAQASLEHRKQVMVLAEDFQGAHTIKLEQQSLDATYAQAFGEPAAELPHHESPRFPLHTSSPGTSMNNQHVISDSDSSSESDIGTVAAPISNTRHDSVTVDSSGTSSSSESDLEMHGRSLRQRTVEKNVRPYSSSSESDLDAELQRKHSLPSLQVTRGLSRRHDDRSDSSSESELELLTSNRVVRSTRHRNASTSESSSESSSESDLNFINPSSKRVHAVTGSASSSSESDIVEAAGTTVVTHESNGIQNARLPHAAPLRASLLPHVAAMWEVEDGLSLHQRRARYKCGLHFHTLSELKTLQELVTGSNVVGRFMPSAKFNNLISLWQGDITKLELDAIVNAANESCLGGGGVDGAIHAAAGRRLLEECRTLGGCAVGQTKITRGYHLPAKYVLHTVGPCGSGDDALRSCYETCLDLVRQNDDIRTIAFCGISTGIFGFPLERACHIALETVRKWLELGDNSNRIDRIVFCNFLPKEVAAYERAVPLFFPAPSSVPSKTALNVPAHNSVVESDEDSSDESSILLSESDLKDHTTPRTARMGAGEGLHAAKLKGKLAAEDRAPTSTKRRTPDDDQEHDTRNGGVKDGGLLVKDLPPDGASKRQKIASVAKGWNVLVGRNKDGTVPLGSQNIAPSLGGSLFGNMFDADSLTEESDMGAEENDQVEARLFRKSETVPTPSKRFQHFNDRQQQLFRMLHIDQIPQANAGDDDFFAPYAVELPSDVTAASIPPVGERNAAMRAALNFSIDSNVEEIRRGWGAHRAFYSEEYKRKSREAARRTRKLHERRHIQSHLASLS